MDTSFAKPTLIASTRRFGDLGGELYPERIAIEGEERIIPHEIGELDQAPHAKLGQRCIAGGLADLVGAEEFPAIVHHGRLIRGQACQLFLLPQAVNDVILDAGLSRVAGAIRATVSSFTLIPLAIIGVGGPLESRNPVGL
jgi:hypothetical protein